MAGYMGVEWGCEGVLLLRLRYPERDMPWVLYCICSFKILKMLSTQKNFRQNVKNSNIFIDN